MNPHTPPKLLTVETEFSKSKILPQFSSCILSEAYGTGSLLIDHLAPWQEFAIMSFTSKNMIIRTWTDLLSLGRNFQSVQAFGFWVILKNLFLIITSDDFTKLIWFSLKMLNDVLTHLQAMLLLIIIQQS